MEVFLTVRLLPFNWSTISAKSPENPAVQHSNRSYVASPVHHGAPNANHLPCHQQRMIAPPPSVGQS